MPSFHPRRILVTGGAGFIGANFVHHLMANVPDLRVVNLDLLTYAACPDNLDGVCQRADYRFVQGDICDRARVDQILREEEIDTVVHFAADSHVDRSITGPAPFIQTNVVGTFTLLDAARVYWLNEQHWGDADCRFHHISTDEVYGTLGRDDPPFTETTAYAPNSPYSASKTGADHIARAYYHTFGLPVVMTNCSNNYGPFQHREKFIPTVILACFGGQPIPVYGDGSNIRDWLYAEDHCRAIMTVLERGRPGESYNIGGDNEWSNLELVRHICSVMDEKRPRHAPHERLLTFVTDRPGHDWRYAIDGTKIERELGWQSAETFDSGIRKTIDWYGRTAR